MQKNETSKVALVTALGVTLLFLAVGGISYSLGWIGFGGSTTHSAQKPSRPEPSSRLDDEVTLICEVTYSMPIEGLDSPPKVYKELVAAGRLQEHGRMVPGCLFNFRVAKGSDDGQWQ